MKFFLLVLLSNSKVLLFVIESYHTLTTLSKKENTSGDNRLLHEVLNPEQEI